MLPIELEDDIYGVIVKVRKGRRTGHVPPADLEVTSEADRNYWPVREYVVWFANRRTRATEAPAGPTFATYR